MSSFIEPKSIHLQQHSNHVEVVVTATPPLAEVMAVLQRLKQDDAYTLRLWNFGDVFFDISLQELITASDFGRSCFIRKNRAAFAARNPDTHALLKEFALFRDQPGLVDLAVFEDVNEAEAWLLAEPS